MSWSRIDAGYLQNERPQAGLVKPKDDDMMVVSWKTSLTRLILEGQTGLEMCCCSCFEGKSCVIGLAGKLLKF